MTSYNLTIAEAGNTWNAVLELIIKKGYTIKINDFGYEDRYWFIVFAQGKEIIASDPLKLLGLILIVELKGDDWDKYDKNYYDLLKEDR